MFSVDALRPEIQARLLLPPPYSESNPPQENDLVIVQLEDGKQIGFVECVGPAGKSANVRFAYEHPSEPVTEHFMARELTLIFRAPKGVTQ